MPMCRSILGLAAALVLAWGSGVGAERYQNRSGLADGRFVWSPTVAPDGPVTIVVSPGERIVHVYRNGLEIGISTIATGVETAGGAYLVSEIDGRIDGDVAPGAALTWRGMDLVPAAGETGDAAAAVAHLPTDFARLLMEVTHRGAAVIVARERSGPQLFSAPGPFVDPLETGSIDSSVARFAQPDLRQLEALTEKPPVAPEVPRTVVDETAAGKSGEITSLVISRADLSAYVMKDGRIVDRLAVAIEQPTKPFGQHIAILVAPGDQRREAQWLGFALDDRADGAHIVADEAQAAMQRIRFLDRGSVSGLARRLKPGTAIVLTDGHGPSATSSPRFDVALLTSEPASASGTHVPQAAASPDAEREAAARGAAKEAEGRRIPELRPTAATKPARTSAPAVGQPAAGKSAPATGKSPRGPLDHREDWPHSMYWPY